MTSGSLTESAAAPGGASWEGAGQWVLARVQFFRPRDGWVSLALLALNLIVIVWSVEQAEWSPTPNLKSLILLAMFTALFLSRIPIWGLLVLPVGFAIGALVILWQLTSFQAEGLEFANTGELLERLHLWWVAAKTGSINIDPAPFTFGLMVATWTSGFLAGWVFFRYGSFWWVFILGGAGLLSNLTYLPSSASQQLFPYLLTALLLIGRVQAVRRRREWDSRNIQYDGHLGWLSASDSVILAVPVLILAFVLMPVGSHWGPTHQAYEYMRSPFTRWEADFNRLFAGLPARRELPYRIWGDVMAFQGEINPSKNPVLQVNSPVAMYWKARTYGTYTSTGWTSPDTVLRPTDWTPTFSVPQPYLKRFDATYAVTPQYSSRSLFVGGQVIGVDQDVRVETYDSPIYQLNLLQDGGGEQVPPKLQIATAKLKQTISDAGGQLTDAELARSLPREFKLVETERTEGRVESLQIAEVIAQQADTLSVRASRGSTKSGETYEVTSSVSLAEPGELRLAGEDYPTWALAKYTQLPEDFPQSVRDLADEVTAEAANPYDQAKAIESYLKQNYTYTFVIEPPPYNSDGVEHFLFDQKAGYSEYFASAMTVMLRSEGIPARLVTGYSLGDKLPDHDVFMVSDNHSHAWLEVFFPNYGWIPFEPTPGEQIPQVYRPVAEPKPENLLGSGLLPLDLLCEEDEEDCDDDGALERGLGQGFGDQASWWQENAASVLPWFIGASVIVIFGTTSSFIFWRRYMVPSSDPVVTFRRLASLGRLGAIGPVDYQTPYQYRQRLDQQFPQQRENLAVIFQHYVGHLYGKKQLDQEDEGRLVSAWTRLRFPLLLHFFRRRGA